MAPAVLAKPRWGGKKTIPRLTGGKGVGPLPTRTARWGEVFPAPLVAREDGPRWSPVNRGPGEGEESRPFFGPGQCPDGLPGGKKGRWGETAGEKGAAGEKARAAHRKGGGGKNGKRFWWFHFIGGGRGPRPRGATGMGAAMKPREKGRLSRRLGAPTQGGGGVEKGIKGLNPPNLNFWESRVFVFWFGELTLGFPEEREEGGPGGGKDGLGGGVPWWRSQRRPPVGLFRGGGVGPGFGGAARGGKGKGDVGGEREEGGGGRRGGPREERKRGRRGRTPRPGREGGDFGQIWAPKGEKEDYFSFSF